MKKLFALLIGFSPGLVLLSSVIGAVSGACNAALLAAINEAVNGANPGDPKILYSYLALLILCPLTLIVSQYILQHLAENVLHTLRMRLVNDMLGVSLRDLERLGSNRLRVALTKDIGTIGMAIITIPGVCTHLTIVIGGFVYLYILYWPVLIGIILGAAIGSWGYVALNEKGRKGFETVREEQNILYKHFDTVTDGIKELKLHQDRCSEFLDHDLQTSSETVKKHRRNARVYYAMAASFSQFVFFAVIGVFVFMTPTLGTTPEMTSGYIFVMLYLFSPLNFLTNSLPTFSDASISLRKVEDLGASLANAYQEDNRAKLLPPFADSLTYREISYTYQRSDGDHPFELGPIDLTIRRGELVFLVGGNGSGKTTLAKLLVGLYIPDSGKVFVDGTEIDDDNRAGFRQLWTTIFSDFYLFDRMIGLKHDDIDGVAQRYLTRLELNEKVQVENGRLSTTNLSQGQRKRLALMTAYLEDRDIYLFDEWAADQDPIFRRTFYHSILPEMKANGKTMIIISHDDAFYHVADRIIKLDYGRIQCDGLPEHLTNSSQVAFVDFGTSEP